MRRQREGTASVCAAAGLHACVRRWGHYVHECGSVWEGALRLWVRQWEGALCPPCGGGMAARACGNGWQIWQRRTHRCE
ncbi:uncharacterized protein DS421_3g87590 [Arachis hypogaea]|nr:uncharacterized protein DS421_3g87590 [Arachis hypogaea]